MNKSVQCPFKDWKVVRQIGKGSYGAVYLIEKQIGSSKETISSAMKIIQLPSSEDELGLLMRKNNWTTQEAKRKYDEIVDEALHEIKVLNDLRGNSHIVNYDDHEDIPHSYGVGSDIYIRMEYLTPLDYWMGERSVTYGDIVRLGIEICEALEVCAKHKIIHKDIKPDNILVSKDGVFKLGDFGIAQDLTAMLQSDDHRGGTLNYLAPEVYHNRSMDYRVDIYGLGMVMYRLLNDRRIPFLPEKASENDADIARNRRFKGEQIPRPAHCIDALWHIIQKACNFDPNMRYASATEMRKALLSIQELPELGQTVSVPQTQETHDASRHRSQTPDHKGEMTPGRKSSSTPKDKDKTDPKKEDEEKEDDYYEEKEDDTPWWKKWKKQIIGAACACCVVILAIVIFAHGTQKEDGSESIEIIADPAPFGLQVSAKGGRSPYEVKLSCSDHVIQEISQDRATFEIDDLTPNTSYVITIKDAHGNEASIEQKTGECESYDAEEFRLYDLSLYACDRLEYKEMSFNSLQNKHKAKIQSDGVVELRDATADAQETCYVIVALTNPGSTPQDSVDVTLVLRLNGGVAVSQDYKMNIKGDYSQNEIPLDGLLTKAYDIYGGWATGNASFEIYTGQKFVGELPLRLTMRGEEQ